MRSAHARRVIHAGVLEAGHIAKLPGAALGKLFHLEFCAEVQTARGARLDAGRLEALADAVHAERALEDFVGLRAELGNVERAAADAVAAPNAVLLLKINDAVGVL